MLRIPSFTQSLINIDSRMSAFLKKAFINQDVKMTASDYAVDVVIALGVFGVSLAQLTLLNGLLIPDEFTRRILGIDLASPSVYALTVIGATSLPLVFRRRYSWITFIICLIAWAVSIFKGNDSVVSIVPLLISLVTLCAMRPMEDSFIAALISFVVVGFMPALTKYTVMTNLMLVQNMSLVFAGAGVGIAFKTTRDLIHSAELRVQKTEEAAKMTTEKRLEEERVAIARELHDITAHSLSAISIQAAAAEAQLDKSVDEAKNTIVGIRKIAKDSLTEIRRMIGILREPTDVDSGPDLAPNMGTEELAEIADYLKAAGALCSVELNNYDRTKVPSFVDITIFGICREATTNIVKHAKATNVLIQLFVQDNPESDNVDKKKASQQSVVLRIADNGVGLSEESGQTGGHGVEGMRERCVALGGTFDIQNGEEGGCLITVVLPVHMEE